MSNISTVYDQILTSLSTVYSSSSSYTQIPDPYDLTNNKETFLRKGYGLKYNGASPEESEFGTYVMTHNFSVVATREVLALDSQTTPRDTATKQLLEDVYLVQQEFFDNSELGIGSSIRKIDLAENSEIIKIDADKKKFRAIEVSFNFLICETY